MKNKLSDTLLLCAVFGIALGFFGNLYEGLVVIPKMLDSSPKRISFWKDFYAVISPVVYYIPVLPLATLLLAVLYFITPGQNTALKKYSGIAILFQLASLLLTFYMVTQVDLKTAFTGFEKHLAEIPAKTRLVNSLSILRLIITAFALGFAFKAYLFTQK